MEMYTIFIIKDGVISSNKLKLFINTKITLIHLTITVIRENQLFSAGIEYKLYMCTWLGSTVIILPFFEITPSKIHYN